MTRTRWRNFYHAQKRKTPRQCERVARNTQ